MELNTGHYDRTDTFLSRAASAYSTSRQTVAAVGIGAIRCRSMLAQRRYHAPFCGELSMFRLNYESQRTLTRCERRVLIPPHRTWHIPGTMGRCPVGRNLWKATTPRCGKTITLYRQALADLPRDRAPQEWYDSE